MFSQRRENFPSPLQKRPPAGKKSPGQGVYLDGMPLSLADRGQGLLCAAKVKGFSEGGSARQGVSGENAEAPPAAEKRGCFEAAARLAAQTGLPIAMPQRCQPVPPGVMPLGGLSDTRPSAGSLSRGCRSGWRRCPHGPASPGWPADPPRFPAGGRQKSGAGCGG